MKHEAGLTYTLPHASWKLKFTRPAADAIAARRQTGNNDNESVGQLYTHTLLDGTVVVSVATELRALHSSRMGVKFDIQAAMEERRRLFSQGLHCVGIWHTHPEPVPSPSGTDLQLAKDYASAAAKQLNAIVFVIAGTSPFPAGLGVWIHDQMVLKRLAVVDGVTSPQAIPPST